MIEEKQLENHGLMQQIMINLMETQAVYNGTIKFRKEMENIKLIKTKNKIIIQLMHLTPGMLRAHWNDKAYDLNVTR
jgi:predicted RNA-binding protein